MTAWPCVPVRRIALVLAGFAATLVASNGIADRSGLTIAHEAGNDERSALLVAYAREAGNEDVLLIGSSRVQSGVMAMLAEPELAERTGRRVRFYELGVAGMRPDLLADVLETVTRHRPPRELLVIAIENRYFCSATDEQGEWAAQSLRLPGERLFRGLEALWSWPGYAARGLFDRVRTLREQRGDRFPPLRLRNRLRIEAADREEVADLFDVEAGAAWRWSEPDEPDQIGWRRCLDVLEGLPCDVLFVKMPLAAGFEESRMPEMTARFRAEVVPAIRERGWQFLDLNRSPWPSHPDLFTGWTHLNYPGAEAATLLFVRDVVAPRLRR